jgi:FAD/FMN-containing dehydrogenase
MRGIPAFPPEGKRGDDFSRGFMLQNIPHRDRVIFKGDSLIESYNHDAVTSGNPDAIVRPRDWQEVRDIVSWCNGNSTPVTVCGARTSMTGSSVTEGGLLITTDHFGRLIDIGKDKGSAFAVVEPGMIVRQFQKMVEEHGFHYPVVPTSCDDAFVGGTVSTNATGEDFYKYGPTRSFVEEISFIRADGSEGTLSRRGKPPPPSAKGRGGYFLGGDEIDHLIGSEGTLAIITRIRLRLLDHIPETIVLMAPFPSVDTALGFIDKINRGHNKPRSLEFIDTYSIKLMQTYKDCPPLSDRAKAYVYIKDEVAGDATHTAEHWFNDNELLDHVIVATTDRQKEVLHQLRHQIPLRSGEMHEALKKNGGCKVAADWWVPRGKMVEMMKQVYKESPELGVEFIAYGHLGDGHPHVNYFCPDKNAVARAKELVKAQCRRAVSYGGGVAAEHGIGKIKRELLPIQYSDEVIKKMRDVKTKFDPNWILGRGNIFG